jgi:hypothetical protein
LNKLILVCLVVGLIGCGKSQEEIRLEKEAQAKALEQEKLKKIEQEKILTENKIKELIKKDLRDPESATFTFQSKNYAHLVCGTVNAKNGFGGYVGDKRFMASEFSYRMDDYSPTDDLVTQSFQLKYEYDWIRMCEGIKPQKGVNLKECEDLSQKALFISHAYVNNPEIPFSDLKRIHLQIHDNKKYIPEIINELKILGQRENKTFPMIYSIMKYRSCLNGEPPFN